PLSGPNSVVLNRGQSRISSRFRVFKPPITFMSSAVRTHPLRVSSSIFSNFASEAITWGVLKKNVPWRFSVTVLVDPRSVRWYHREIGRGEQVQAMSEADRLTGVEP